MSLLDDWQSYRAQGTGFDALHFEFLLKSHRDPEELVQIFAGLPNADQTIDRLQTLFHQTRRGGFDYQLPDPSGAIEVTEAAALARVIRDDTTAFLRRIGEDGLADELQDLPVRLGTTDELKAAGKDLNHLQFGLGDAIGDHYLGQVFDPPHVSRALYEAVRALTAYAALTRYILDPIWPYAQKYEEDMQLYLGGYSYFYTNTEMLLVRH